MKDIIVVGISFNQIIIRLSKERARERVEAGLRARLETLRFEPALGGSGADTESTNRVHDHLESMFTKREKRDEESM